MIMSEKKPTAEQMIVRAAGMRLLQKKRNPEELTASQLNSDGISYEDWMLFKARKRIQKTIPKQPDLDALGRKMRRRYMKRHRI